MENQSDPFVLPELPDEAAAALDHFLEDFYNGFQKRYGIQLYRYYRALDERAARHRPMLNQQLPLRDPPF
jgi:predicted component of type VI protein secretion system